jgi:hypothetical protein
MAAVEAERRAPLQTSSDASLDTVRQLLPRTGSGSHGAWLGVRAFWGWRGCQHRRAVGGLAGCPPTPYHRGERARDQGMTQSGNRQVRGRTPAWAWSGRRLQPARALRGGLRERFGGGGTRGRRIEMVAVARQWLMALGRCLATGVFPAGAARKEA